jgi:hypothetical protein
MKTMKSSLWKMMIAAALIVPVALVSCQDEFFHGINGYGDPVKRTVDPGSINGVVSAIAADIYLTQGDQQEIVIEAQENVIDNLVLDDVSNGIWTLRYKLPLHFFHPIKIYITMPGLTKAVVAGSGRIEGTTPFTGLGDLRLNVSGSGLIRLEAEAASVNSSITGSGCLELAGTTDRIALLISGSGNCRATGLMAREADATITGSGSARLNVGEYLKASITGSGYVYYQGDPEVDVHVSGSGRVRKDF